VLGLRFDLTLDLDDFFCFAWQAASYAGATRVRGLCGVIRETDGGEAMAETLLGEN